MSDLIRVLVGAAGACVIAVGLAGVIRVILGRPKARPPASALEMIFWFVAVITMGGLVILAATRL